MKQTVNRADSLAAGPLRTRAAHTTPRHTHIHTHTGTHTLCGQTKWRQWRQQVAPVELAATTLVGRGGGAQVDPLYACVCVCLCLNCISCWNSSSRTTAAYT